jgi:hypothetical protein
MVDRNQIESLSEEWKGKDSTLAEFICTLFKDKYVELYLGDSYEEVRMEQTSCSYPAVFCGKVIAAFKECLVIEALHVDKSKKVQSGSILLINERAIRGMTEVNDHHTLQDMILRSGDVFSVYEAFTNGKEIKKIK